MIILDLRENEISTKADSNQAFLEKKKQAKKQILLACNEVQLYALTVYNTGSRSKKFLLDYIEIKLNKTMFLFFELIVSCLYRTIFSIK